MSLRATYDASFVYHRVLIDTDQNVQTGYRDPIVANNNFGADYLIENDGVFRSTGTSWSWRAVGGVNPLKSSSGGTFSWQVSRTALGGATAPLRVIFNGDANGPESSGPVLNVGSC